MRVVSEGKRKGWWRGKRMEMTSRAALATRTFLSRRAAHMAETWVVVCVWGGGGGGGEERMWLI